LINWKSTPEMPPGRFTRAAVLTFIVLVWTFTFFAGKLALRHMNALTLSSFRIELAAIVLLIVYAVRGNRRRFGVRDYGLFAVLGIFGVLMNIGLFTLGLGYTSTGHSSIIQASAPILVLILASMKGLESFTVKKAVGLALAFIGIVELSVEQGLSFRSGVLAGDLITMLGTLGFAVYAVYGKKYVDQYDALSMLTFNNVSAAIILLPLAVYEGAHLRWSKVGWVGWAGMAHMAILSSVVAYLMFYWILRYISASRLAAISYFEPIAVVILSIFFLGEQITRSLIVGGVLVLFGVYLTETGRE
jgi:drug/metabolite transporter (DMT)-like permease